MRSEFRAFVACLITLGAGLTAHADEVRGTVQGVKVSPDAYGYGKVTVRTSSNVWVDVEFLSSPGGSLTPLTPETAAMVIAVASAYPDSINFLNLHNSGGYYYMHAGSSMYGGWSRSMAHPTLYRDATSGRIGYISVFGDAAAGAYATITMTRADGGTTWLQLRSTSETVNGYTNAPLPSRQALRIVQAAAGAWFLRFVGHYTLAPTNSNVARLYLDSDVYTGRN